MSSPRSESPRPNFRRKGIEKQRLPILKTNSENNRHQNGDNPDLDTEPVGKRENDPSSSPQASQSLIPYNQNTRNDAKLVAIESSDAASASSDALPGNREQMFINEWLNALVAQDERRLATQSFVPPNTESNVKMEPQVGNMAAIEANTPLMLDPLSTAIPKCPQITDLPAVTPERRRATINYTIKTEATTKGANDDTPTVGAAPKPAHCGNFQQPGHKVMTCNHIGSSGAVEACPICNEKHFAGGCQWFSQLSARDAYYLFVKCRDGRPQIASPLIWQSIPRPQNVPEGMHQPHSLRHAKEYAARHGGQYPQYETHRDDSALEEKLPSFPEGITNIQSFVAPDFKSKMSIKNIIEKSEAAKKKESDALASRTQQPTEAQNRRTSTAAAAQNLAPCTFCRKTDHTSAACRNQTGTTVVEPCLNCGRKSHITKECNDPCKYCNRAGHQAPDCPSRRQEQVAPACQNCGRFNHKTADCTRRLRACQHCGLYDHQAENCDVRRQHNSSRDRSPVRNSRRRNYLSRSPIPAYESALQRQINQQTPAYPPQLSYYAPPQQTPVYPTQVPYYAAPQPYYPPIQLQVPEVREEIRGNRDTHDGGRRDNDTRGSRPRNARSRSPRPEFHRRRN